MPSISVIIPAYNQAAYVAESVNSVLTQTYADFELVVVDDGSTDETSQILASFQDPRMRVVRQSNAGLSAARNTGMRESSAPLITLLDSDDYFYPEKLAVLKEYLDAHPETGMVSGGTRIVNQAGTLLREDTRAPAPADMALPDLLLHNPFTPSAVMFRRAWIDKVGDFDETLRACEDWDEWLRMAYAGCCFAWVERPVTAYRYHQGQMTRESARMRKAMLSMLDKFYRQPDLPAPLAALKNKAYASAYITAAAYAYHSDQIEEGQENLLQALQLDLTLKDQHYERLVTALVGWSDDPRSMDHGAFLQRIIDNPPPRQPGLVRQLRLSLADVILGGLFPMSHEERRAYRSDLLKVIINKPGWLFNRGVLRMLADAWLRPGSPDRK